MKKENQCTIIINALGCFYYINTPGHLYYINAWVGLSRPAPVRFDNNNKKKKKKKKTSATTSPEFSTNLSHAFNDWF
jgi:hypothetical protein